MTHRLRMRTLTLHCTVYYLCFIICISVHIAYIVKIKLICRTDIYVVQEITYVTANVR